MGHTKRHQKTANAHVMRNTRNRTRIHKTKLFTDPAQSTLQLTTQLRTLGLYAAPTLGDGNCLFRALSDQLWGTPNHHLTLRKEICDWMEANKERYEGFVDDDRTFEQHLGTMRVPGTYGGHLELSAFAHLKRRNVKVIQPGLVYVIEWNCGWVNPNGEGNSSGAGAAEKQAEEAAVVVNEADDPDEAGLNERDKRRLRREEAKREKDKKAKGRTNGKMRGKSKEPSPEAEEDLTEEEGEEDDTKPKEHGAVYVAYHDWEHFSSIRNLAGPHTGLPNVVERPARSYEDEEISTPLSPQKPKPKSKAAPKSKGKAKSTISSSEVPPVTAIDPMPSSLPTKLTPSQIPLPPSRSPSPAPSTSLSPPSSLATASLTGPARSPKRTFDESEESTSATGSGSSISPRKRQRHKRNATVTAQTVNAMDVDIDDDEKTPSLSDDDNASTASSSSLSSIPSVGSSSAPSPSLSITVTPKPKPAVARLVISKPVVPSPLSKSTLPTSPIMTRRQRKALGLPNPRTERLKAETAPKKGAGFKKGVSAGKIIIPGGRREGLRSAGKVKPAEEEEAAGEWARNGTGRLDVRGFKELKI